MGSLRVGHDWGSSLSLFTFMHWRRKWQPTPVFLPGESQGRGSLVGCRLWGHTESDTTDTTSAEAAEQLDHWRVALSLRYGSSRVSLWLSGKESTCQCRRPGFSPSSQILGGEYGSPLQHSCLENPIIPWTEEPGRLLSMGPQRVRHDWAHMHIRSLH